jgi:hypothetical protein
VIAVWERTTSFRPEVKEQYLHPIDGTLLEQTAERGRSAFSLAVNNEDHRQLGSVRFSFSIFSFGHACHTVYQAHNVGSNVFGGYLTR